MATAAYRRVRLLFNGGVVIQPLNSPFSKEGVNRESEMNKATSFPRSRDCESIIKMSLKTYSPRRHEDHEGKIIV